MKRSEFLKNLGMSSASLMAFYCLGGITACSSEDPEPANQNNTGGNTSGKVNLTLNLNEAANSSLTTNGGFRVLDNTTIIVARTNGGNFVALSKDCTHQGTEVTYQAANDRFNCPNHGSNFSTTGSVLNGPASSPLKQYQTEFNATSNTLRVFES